MIDQETLKSDTSKEKIFGQVREMLKGHGLMIVAEDMERPWGGFFVIDEEQLLLFRDTFFKGLPLNEDQLKQKLSPKILLVSSEKRLSWQYHHRRAEVWKLIYGEGAISVSKTNEEGPVQDLPVGEIVKLAQGERHRLIGTKSWGVVAEIWLHTDPENPSDEDDIVRVQDDFSRK